MNFQIDVNVKLRRPEWEFLSGFGWANGNQDEVVAVRFGPRETVIARALSSAIKEAGTTLIVEFIADGMYMRTASKDIKKSLPHLTEASLVQYWSRMITAAQKWPWK